MAWMWMRTSTLLMTLRIGMTMPQHEDGKCVKLAVPMCSDMQYNLTLIPNPLTAIDDMAEATRRISEFSPLFKVDCYANFKFFICNMFLPICHNLNGKATPVYPCRHVCELARDGCEPLMQRYSFEWPSILSCERLQRFEDMQNDPSRVCGSPPVEVITPIPSGHITRYLEPTTLPDWVEALQKFPDPIVALRHLLTKNPRSGIDLKEFSEREFCKISPKYVSIKKDKEKELCLPRCEADVTFTKEDKKFAEVWISTWSIICFLSTLLTVSTFLVDHKRFKYPERPIIFLSFCYNLYSIGYLIRVFGSYGSVVCEYSANGRHIVSDGMSSTSCTLVFFFLYFFGMASAIWWVILSLTWFMSAALKWGHEAIEKYASIFHAVAWAIPTVQTIVALVSRKIDPDQLSGLCYIGNNESRNLLLFVVVPLTIYLAFGTIFLVLGFFSLIRIRKLLRRERNTMKLERLMVRIGIFSVLYSVPASIVVGCFMHEYLRLKNLEDAISSNKCGFNPDCMRQYLPKPEVFYLRYFMLLVVGVTSGVWIWSSKTVQSWTNCYRGCCGVRDYSMHEEKRQLYSDNKAPSSLASSYARKPVAHRESLPRINPRGEREVSQVVKLPGSLHGSQTHVHQQQMYVPAPARFFFPLQQPPAGYMHAQNVVLPQVMDENYSRGYTVTPLSSITSSMVTSIPYHNHAADTLTNVTTPAPPSSTYSRSVHSSMSDGYPRNGHVQRPSSPMDSSSSRSLSHRSGNDANS